ncbi:MAG: acyl-CoA thioesterase [Fimbriimonas ginsengisoli]|uniref:Acyl-CoA thioesterase n=1 Tax=Fimbriimonas ginsengisoli TaxID=1005039 RepID=A0A931PV72_FIMGI|nr:acyl-CoA thioesterase [Fimbriimonas ginsengisoli]
MSAKPASASRVEMSEVMTPNDANFLGKVFGGRVLSMLDIAAYATASRFAGHVCVTASVDRVDFHEPIEVGELVTCVGTVTYVGRTSLEVTIEVFAENVLKGERRHTNTARVTMVAMDEALRPVEVPRLICETREEKVRFLEGRLRREIRGAHQSEFERLAAGFAAASDARLDELLAAPSLMGVAAREG